MRLAIDIRPLAEPTPGGIPAYTRHIARGLLAYHQHEITLFSSGTSRPNFSHQEFPQVQRRHVGLPNKALNMSVNLFQRPYLDRLSGGTDVFFAPNFPFVTVSPQCRLVVTAHDLSFVHFAHLASMKIRLWHRLSHPERVFRRADAIIAISQATARDLAATWDLDPRKIVTIPSGVDPEPFERMTHSRAQEIVHNKGISGPYILSVGPLEARKNLHIPLTAYERLLKDGHANMRYVIVGMSVWNRDRRLENKLRAREIVSLGWVSEEEKVALIKQSLLVIFPSLYEGFGFPILEAMSAGVPCVVSSNSASSEIAGDAALTVDPNDVSAWTHALRMLLTDDKLRTTLRERGVRRARQFTWDKTIRETANVLFGTQYAHRH